MRESERFWTKVRKTRSCWLWEGALTTDGYGQFWDGEKVVKAHRWIFEQENGELAEGVTLDHLCRRRNCVRTAHLEAVSFTENVLRGEGWTARNARKTQCPSGHEYDAIDSRGRRFCLRCSREQKLASYHRRQGKGRWKWRRQ